MADPTPLSHSTTYARWTLQEIRDYAMFVAGGVWADLDTTEQAILDKLINAAHSQRHRLTRNTRRWAEEETTLTWVDGDDSIALPANIAEIVGRHLWQVNSSGEPLAVVEIIREEDYLDGFFPQSGEPVTDATSMWDNRETPVARIYREEDGTQKRILWVYPRPDGGDLFKILYLSEANKLSNANDILEAPTAYNQLVAYDSAIEWLLARGDTERAVILVQNRDRLSSELTNARETDRPLRARWFDEVGYPGTRQAEPVKSFLPLR